jgi:signal recognition particle receptor subunit beta
MAVLDPKDDCVVIRIVYDGAPMAGKTTSVAALGRGLGAGVYSPADVDGRTLYFDWLDYTGGLFEGHRIRCQIVSVPGQATLAPRRRRLLESADVVVFVGDGSPAGFEADRRYLGALQGVLQRSSGPPVGIVLQANKRDLPDATPLDDLRAMLDSLELRIGIVESVATEGFGIREAFVFAVRLALDRVRELIRTGDLGTVRPKIDSAQDLLQELSQAEDGALDLAIDGGLKHTRMRDVMPTSIASQALQEAMRGNADTPIAPAATCVGEESRNGEPAIPDETVASGLVWPPVDGRLILHEIASTKDGLRLASREADGSWCGVIAGRWRLHSAANAVFDTVDEGRSELVQWARLHAASAGALSKDRCIVLAADGSGRHRLWQIVRQEISLRSQMEHALNDTTESVAGVLVLVARSFLHMAERLSGAACELRLSLADISASTAGPSYLGLMPHPVGMCSARQWSRTQARELLLTELNFALPVLRACRRDLLAELMKISRADAHADWPLLQRLAALTRD